MFTVGSYHKNFSIILITQNLFPRIRVARDISLNAHYIILFRNNRDQSQIACFGRQVFPDRSKFFMDAYKKATAEKYQFLLVDCFPRIDEEFRLRQSLFPDQRGVNWVFVPELKKMNRIKRHVHLLHVLSSASPQQRNAILKSASNEQIKTLCEICQNVLAGNVSKAKVRQLCRYKKVIRQLADRNIPIAPKRELLTNQTCITGSSPPVFVDEDMGRNG
ncbi:hypothetical protein AVEN_75464-1 [Araneus ventricosus]|uniref:Uncharacterized protein n=1 Tax=Araneus ventricosus TaxID=182803 RepID=A0A4Y2WAA3_ARAVE|nr:hypothetical protein AVEN_75464-1 [Araneus ventricosus]